MLIVIFSECHKSSLCSEFSYAGCRGALVLFNKSYSLTVLQSYSLTVLQSYSLTVLQSYSLTVLQSYSLTERLH